VQYSGQCVVRNRLLGKPKKSPAGRADDIAMHFRRVLIALNAGGMHYVGETNGTGPDD